MKFRLILILFCILSMGMLYSAEITFSSDLIRNSVSVLGLHRLDTIPEGMSFLKTDSYGPMRITKRKGKIIHLGRQLFDSRIYGRGELPVLDYLEFAALDHSAHISDNPYLYHTLQFKAGSWAQLSIVTPDTPCRITSTDNRYYEVSWQLPQDELIVCVPVDYDRLALMSRREIEGLFLDQMRSYVNSGNREQLVKVPDAMPSDSRGIYTMAGNKYMLSTINDNQYYLKDDEGDFTLVCDTSFPAETMSNLVNAHSYTLPVVTMEIDFDAYDYRTDHYRIALPDFLSFCEQQGCQCFWGLEKVKGTEVKGTIFLYNGVAGYNHVVHVQADIRDVLESAAKVEARASLFVPVHNIDSLIQN